MLPINLDDLLGARTVESNSIEFKEGWNPDAIYRTICAFANDFDNTGGGYVVIGVAEEQGRAQRPVKGLSTEEISRIQREMIGFNNLIRPVYHSRLSVEEVDDSQIIVLWVPGSAHRPHEVPESIKAPQKTYRYYLRQYASSVKANPTQQKELIALTNQVPFDDRPNTLASLADISLLWIKEYLRVSRSRLFDIVDTLTTSALLDQMELLSGPPEHRFPRNVALMLFCETPEKFFPYTYIELVDFQRGSGGKTFTEYTFRGPVQYQIRQLMDKLRSLALVEKVIKVKYQSESLRPWTYPVRVFLYPDCLIFLNGGGPDRAIRAEDFATGQVRPKQYRNRRLGSFLKALQLTEGYATGIRLMLREMEVNGSERPVFTTNEERTFFEVEFKRHPAFTVRDIMAPTGSGKTTAGEDAATKQWLASLKPNSLQILRTMPATPQRPLGLQDSTIPRFGSLPERQTGRAILSRGKVSGLWSDSGPVLSLLAKGSYRNVGQQAR